MGLLILLILTSAHAMVNICFRVSQIITPTVTVCWGGIHCFASALVVLFTRPPLLAFFEKGGSALFKVVTAIAQSDQIFVIGQALGHFQPLQGRLCRFKRQWCESCDGGGKLERPLGHGGLIDQKFRNEASGFCLVRLNQLCGQQDVFGSRLTNQ